MTKEEKRMKSKAAAEALRAEVGNEAPAVEAPAEVEASTVEEAPAAETPAEAPAAETATAKVATITLEDAKALTAQRKVREKRVEYQEIIKSVPADKAGVIEIPEFKDYVRERIRLQNAANDLSLKLEMKKVNTQLYFWVVK